MSDCSDCGKPLASTLACTACGRLFAPEEPLDPFAVFGLSPAFGVDQARLQKDLLRLQRAMHPDFFAGAPAAAHALAERNTAELNSAFELLSDDFRRADWLVKARGGPDENEQRDMPREFLVEVMDWNEVLENARAAATGSAAHAAAFALRERLLSDRRDLFGRIGALLEPLPERGSQRLVDARRALNAVRYVDRALEQIEELRLQRAPSARS